jgi:hypothetical protein
MTPRGVLAAVVVPVLCAVSGAVLWVACDVVASWVLSWGTR